MQQNEKKNFIPLKIKIFISCIAFMMHAISSKAQSYESQSIIYNSLLGGISSCVGALINKKKEDKWSSLLLKNFAIGVAGGAVVYSGKKLNTLIAKKDKLGYSWVSRGVFYAGMSVIENTAAGKKFWATWHYDIGFVRLEFDCKKKVLQPKVMPAAFGATLFLAYHGKLDIYTSLESGVPTFHTKRIGYQPQLIGSTVTNGFLLNDTLNVNSRLFYNTYSHEMIHSFQFTELSGVNQWFKPYTAKWETESTVYKNIHKWVYGDLNYELMLINYFIVQGGVKRNYCRNFLENEAEYLSMQRSACEGLPE